MMSHQKKIHVIIFQELLEELFLDTHINNSQYTCVCKNCLKASTDTHVFIMLANYLAQT